MTKTYTQRGNCIRAARVALGKTAKPGVDFLVVGEAPAFMWRQITGTHEQVQPTPAMTDKAKKAKPAKKAKAKKVSTVVLSEQTQMLALIKLCQRVNGATIEEMCERLSSTNKPLASHTVRGNISRLNKEGNVSITSKRDGRIKHYHCAA